MKDDIERVNIENVVLPFDYMCNCFAGEPESFATVSQLSNVLVPGCKAMGVITGNSNGLTLDSNGAMKMDLWFL